MGYANALMLVQIGGKLLILSCFIIYRHRRESTQVLPIVIMPFAMAMYVCLQTQQFIILGEKLNERNVKITAVVNEVCSNYRLIADYAQRPHVCELFTKSVQALNAAGMPLNVMQKNSAYFPSWLATLFTCAFMIYSSQTVLDGDMSLGNFLATVKIYAEIGGGVSWRWLALWIHFER